MDSRYLRGLVSGQIPAENQGKVITFQAQTMGIQFTDGGVITKVAAGTHAQSAHRTVRRQLLLGCRWAGSSHKLEARLPITDYLETGLLN